MRDKPSGATGEIVDELAAGQIAMLIKQQQQSQSVHPAPNRRSVPRQPREDRSSSPSRARAIRPPGRATNRSKKAPTEWARTIPNRRSRRDQGTAERRLGAIASLTPANRCCNRRPEQFLPKYELLIEKYYKRLAEEQKQKP